MVTKTDSSLIVHDGGTIKDVLDTAKPIANYTALRAYTGSAMQIRITTNGLAGFFYYDASDTTSTDNGGTIIVSGNGKRWKRIFSGPVMFEWFGATGYVDDTAAITGALNSGYPVTVTAGRTFICNSVSANNVIMSGHGVIKKKQGTKGAMLSLTGDNLISEVGFDYDWQNADQALPYWPNTCITLSGGSLVVLGARFSKTFSSAIKNNGGSLRVEFSKFKEGAPHNNLSGGNERVTGYIDCAAPVTNGEQSVQINNNEFVGASTDSNLLHLNPSGVMLTASTLDGNRFKHVNITGNVFIACGQNAGAGNVTGAIDTYNGVENLVITGNTIRYFSYAGIKVQNSSVFCITGNTIIDGKVPVGSATDQSVGVITYQKVRGSITNQYNGTIVGNTIKGTRYYAIGNNVDNVVISNNVIDGVEKANIGNAILNSGSNVTISSNIGTYVGGTFVESSGSSVKIVNNTFDANAVAGGSGVSFSGADIKIHNNTFRSSAGSVYSAIRTDGNSTDVSVSGNTMDGFYNGTDVRITNGPVDGLEVGINIYKNIGNVSETINPSATNVSRIRKNLPQVQVTYDPPSLTVGTCGPVQTLTITGAELGDEVYGTGVRNMLGLYVMAWVSASNTVSWAVCNPVGNPSGTQDFPNMYFRFRVVKQQI